MVSGECGSETDDRHMNIEAEEKFAGGVKLENLTFRYFSRAEAERAEDAETLGTPAAKSNKNSAAKGKDTDVRAQPEDTVTASTRLETAGHDHETILKKIDLEVKPGSCTVLTGFSGSGKSSLLRLCNGLIPHLYKGKLDGRIEAAGIDITASDFVDIGERVATVFQNPRTQFFAIDTTSEIAFGLENYGMPREEILRRIADAATATGSQHLLERNIFKLSGGEKQLIACASAVAREPRLFLFDEPTSNLSQVAIKTFAKVLQRLVHAGHTVLVAEHRLHYLREIADRIIYLRDGKIVGDHTAKEFWALPPETITRYGWRSLHTPNLSGMPVNHTNTPVKNGTNPNTATTDSNAKSIAAAAALAEATGLPAERHASAPKTVATSTRSTSTPKNSETQGLTLKELRYSYGNKHVLNIPHLHIPRGQVIAIMGENGAGKSTLANVLTGIYRAKGTIKLDGKKTGAAARRQKSYVVMQDVHRQLFANSVNAEVTLGLNRKQREKIRVNELLDRFQLAEYQARHPLSLSGGQKQRLVIAAALAADKQVYVFDEPTSGLDHPNMLRIAETLKELANQNRVVTVVTHDLELVQQAADKIILLDKLDKTKK